MVARTSHTMFQSPATSVPGETQSDLEILLVQIEHELYALPSSSVREVARYRPWTPVPGAPATLPGVINQRGMILPIVEPRPLLGLEQAELTRAARLVIVIPASTLEPVPAALEPARARLLRGVAHHENQPIGLLDLDELIASLREMS